MQFQKFKKICALLNKTPSSTYETVHQILLWRNESNKKMTIQKGKYNDTFILQRAEFYWNKNKKIIQIKNESILRD